MKAGTSRTTFNESWLSESPENIGNIETYSAVNFNIRDMISSGFKPEDVGNGYFKIHTGKKYYYWYEENGEILIGAELYQTPENLTIEYLGKKPELRWHPPYASDLYKKILDDDKIIRFANDTKLSENGFKVWQKLFDEGYKITIYEQENPGQSMKTITSKNELNNYFGADKKFENYQFVLSNPKMLGECRSYFLTRRLRELSGLGTED